MLKGKGGEKWFWDRGKIISTSPFLGMWIDCFFLSGGEGGKYLRS
jgi:hypothetical protein